MNRTGNTRVSDNCEAHRRNYPARSPNLALKQYQDEVDQIGAQDGLFELVYPPAAGIIFGVPPCSDADVPQSEACKYLWVVALETLPGALEHHATATALKRGRLAHTNLTGGADAHTAGELWFRDPMTIMLNGSSSRYKPRNAKECKVSLRPLKLPAIRWPI